MDFKLVICDTGDWEGLYINNQLELEAHKLRVADVLSIQQSLRAFPTSFSLYEVKGEVVEYNGGLRTDFEDNYAVKL